MQCAAGIHTASWRDPRAVPGAANSIEYYTDIARLAERGLFDMFFVADTPAARTDNLQAWSRYPLFMNSFEPLTLLAALATQTRRTTSRGSSVRSIM